MIFDVVKVTRGFSKWGEKETSHNLSFEVVPKDRGRLDFGDNHVLIGRGYHPFRAEDRQPVIATVSISSDAESLDRISGERPICGAAFFYRERDDDLSPQPATLAINVVVEPQTLEGMARTAIKEAGAATLNIGIDGLDFGPAMDGSHQIWSLEDASDCGHATRRRVTDFWYSVETFWTSEGGIREAEERQTNAWLADRPEPEGRRLTQLNQPPTDDRVAGLLGQCRWLLFALLVVGAISLAACGQAKDDCLDLPVYPPAGIVDLKQEVFACVERSAASYARGTDTPEAISKAVVVKCQPRIIRYVEWRAKDLAEQPQYGAALEAWREHALPVIAEARSRGCYS